MIRSSTIPSIGRVGRRWASWRRQQHAVVVKRAGGLCEGCGKDSRRLEVAHLMGRRNIVSEPWASWSGLCAHLCAASVIYGLGCHELMDANRNEPLRVRLLRGSIWHLVDRLDSKHLGTWWDGRGLRVEPTTVKDCIGTVRRLIEEEFKPRGIEP